MRAAPKHGRLQVQVKVQVERDKGLSIMTVLGNSYLSLGCVAHHNGVLF